MAAEIATTKPGAKTGWWFQPCFIFPFYLGWWSNLTNSIIFQRGWNHQAEKFLGAHWRDHLALDLLRDGGRPGGLEHVNVATAVPSNIALKHKSPITISSFVTLLSVNMTRSSLHWRHLNTSCWIFTVLSCILVDVRYFSCSLAVSPAQSAYVNHCQCVSQTHQNTIKTHRTYC